MRIPKDVLKIANRINVLNKYDFDNMLPEVVMLKCAMKGMIGKEILKSKGTPLDKALDKIMPIVFDTDLIDVGYGKAYTLFVKGLKKDKKKELVEMRKKFNRMSPDLEGYIKLKGYALKNKVCLDCAREGILKQKSRIMVNEDERRTK